ncbi:MAG: hypothetical protein R2726_10825 [Acidimicrobiales bacterium]
MHALDLALLQSVHEYPAVSLLCPTGPTEDQTRRRLIALARNARERLVDEFGADDPAVVELLTRLDDAVDQAPPLRARRSVAVFVSASTSKVFHLDVVVREREVVDETFATRDLVHDLLRRPRYLVLVLSGRVTRLYDGVGERLEERRGNGFPVVRPGEVLDEPGARARGIDPSQRRERELRRFVRAVDEALAPHLRTETAPLLVVGATRRLATFCDTSRHRAAVAARIDWAREQPAVGELAARVHPAVERLLHERRRAALADLDRAAGAHRACSGIEDIWRLSREGRGELLVVEAGYEFPARVDDEDGGLVPADDSTAPDVIDDAVDEIIEHVLARRGAAVIVPDGELADHGRIAMTLRH